MATIITRPSATLANTGALSNPGTETLHGNLSDDDDATYVTMDPGEGCEVRVADPSIPAASALLRTQLRIRCRRIGPSGYSRLTSLINHGADGELSLDIGLVTWTSPTEYTGNVLTWPVALTGPDLDEPDFAELSVELAASVLAARVYELYFETIHVPQSVATVTYPTGTITDDATPAVIWSSSFDADGGTPSHYEVKLFTAAQYGAGGFDPDTSAYTYYSGEVAGSPAPFGSGYLGLHDETPVLANGDYRAYVRTAQTVNGELHWSDWDYEAFTMNVPVPADPTFTATEQGVVGRILLEVADPGGGAATTDYFEIQASYDGGATWRQIRTPSGDGLITGGDAWDWEAPNGTLATYRARALHDYAGAGYGYSDWVEASATWTSSDVWIKHPTAPGLNLRIAWGDVLSFAGTTRTARTGIFQPLGATYPVAIGDTRSSEAGELVVLSDSADERDAIDVLLAQSVPLLLQFPPLDDEPDRWISIGDSSRTRVADKSFVSARREAFAFVTVDRPTDLELATEYGLYPASSLYPAEELAPA